MQGRKQHFLAKRTRRARSFAALAFGGGRSHARTAEGVGSGATTYKTLGLAALSVRRSTTALSAPPARALWDMRGCPDGGVSPLPSGSQCGSVRFAKVGCDLGHAVQPSPWQTSSVRGGVGARPSGGS